MKPVQTSPPAGYLGIEAGGTRTTARYESAAGSFSVDKEFGPANLRLVDDVQLIRHFRTIARTMPRPMALAIGMAGARNESDRARIRRAAERAWPGVPRLATNDLETALMAADEPSRKRSKVAATVSDGGMPRVLMLSGTGSCCFGRAPNGRTAKVGGWGHILGDKGSAYEIGLRALKAVVYYHDRDGRWSSLGQGILQSLMLNEPDDLIDWVRSAGKDEIARVALEVFAAWSRRDRIATDILTGAANSLARDAVACARRLRPRGGPVHFVLAGGVLLKQTRFARSVERELVQHWPGALVSSLQRTGVEGAVRLARSLRSQEAGRAGAFMAGGLGSKRSTESGDGAPRGGSQEMKSRGLPATERRNPRSKNLDRMPIASAIDLMIAEDSGIARALKAERQAIARGVGLIVSSLRQGGRLIYVGAGTSGRLGVLDASECPPTFRTPPELVQGIIAGGQTALWSAAEGAEDDLEAGARAVRFRGLTKLDTVVGIAASGRTPFVWGALDEGRRVGANTILLCFNPELVIPCDRRPKLVIAPKIGPEVLTGSTRLKAGTATKLVLNMFTTLAMVQLGKVRSNLMIDVKASNVKLRDRAVRIAQELTGADAEAARAALIRHGWRIAEAESALRRGVRVSVKEPRRRVSDR